MYPYLKSNETYNVHFCIITQEPSPDAFSDIASGLLKVRHKVSRSKHQALRGGTNDYSLGSSMGISSPLRNSFASDKLMDDHPFYNRSLSWRWDKLRGFSFLSTRSPKLSSSVDMEWDMCRSLLAQSRGHIAHQNSIAHHCCKTKYYNYIKIEEINTC